MLFGRLWCSTAKNIHLFRSEFKLKTRRNNISNRLADFVGLWKSFISRFVRIISFNIITWPINTSGKNKKLNPQNSKEVVNMFLGQIETSGSNFASMHLNNHNTKRMVGYGISKKWIMVRLS